jgi:GNAT superfamily N-acetyltransferase
MQYEPFSIDRLRDILKLGIAMQEESDYVAVQFDIEQSARSIVSMVIDNPNGFGMLAYDGDKPVGMIAGSVSPYFFSKGKLASDFVWYVLPEARGSRTSVKLLKMFTDYATGVGATELYMGVTTNVGAARTGALLERMGFQHVGGNYRKRLNVGS